jgi:hypothetical protein
MDSFKIAIIKPNNVVLNHLVNIIDVIKNYVELVEVNSETMMETVVDTIKLNTELMGSTTICKEDDKFVYQLCHLNMAENEGTNNEEDFNAIGSYLVMGNKKIYGSCVLICSSILNSGLCSTSNVTFENIINILSTKIIHCGIMVSVDNTVEDIHFINDPMENYSDDQIKNYKWMEVSILKFNLLVFIQSVPTKDIINKKGTRLVGTYRVHGDIIVVSKSSEDEYIDIDKKLFNDILSVCGGPLSSRTLKEDEKMDGERIDNLPVVQNRFCLLKKRLALYNQNRCDNCSEIYDNNNNICTGCYRLSYHNEQCQKNGWESHKLDCTFNKQQINIFLEK